MSLRLIRTVPERASVRCTSVHCAVAAILSIAAAACGDGTGPGDRSVEIAVAAGDAQFGIPGDFLEEPLQVTVTDPANDEPVEDVAISWRVTSGEASLAETVTRSDALGIAQVTLRLGGELGTVTIEATAPGGIGGPATFSAAAIDVPVITAVDPTTVKAGETVTITGTNFPTTPSDAAVLFDGLRATISTLEPGRITATAPPCILTRTAAVRVQIGAVASQAVPVETIAASDEGLRLEAGTVMRLDAAGELECLRFDAATAGTRYLVVPQNVTDILRGPVRWELLGRTGRNEVVTLLPRATTPATGEDWELALRRREQSLYADVEIRSPDAARLKPAAAVQPRLGDRRDFNVLTPTQDAERITAEVRAISQHVVIYVDLEAPANGFNDVDLQSFGDLFDDPVYETTTTVFGAPSDVDGNDRVIILFTPSVNALTERDEESFIAGYFFGCDLVAPSRCAETNGGEILYSMVPDPGARFGDARSKDLVLRTVPGILAHEFQHMIHFGQKGTLDALWLSEGLAHAAEDLVGEVFAVRGDLVRADEFQRPNHVRVTRYMRATGETSLIAENSPGTLELRGGAWLFVRYLTEHYGGDALLGRLTRSQRSSVANVTTETGQTWERLLGDFAVALWADDAPELRNNTALDPRFTFPDLDLRLIADRFSGGFPLQPPELPIADFSLSQVLPSSAQEYFFLVVPASPPPFDLSFTGVRGGPFPPDASTQLLLLRIR
jgi:hypothetical protein